MIEDNGGHDGHGRGRWSYASSSSQWSGPTDSHLSTPMDEMDEDSDHSWGNLSLLYT